MTSAEVIEFVKACGPKSFGVNTFRMPMRVESVFSGESNRVYVVNIGHMRLAVKENGVATKDEDFFRNEFEKLRALEEWQVSPRPYIYNRFRGRPVMVLQYIEGTPLTSETLGDHIDGIVRILNKMASVPLSYLRQYPCFRRTLIHCYDYARMIVEYATAQLDTYRTRCGDDDLSDYVKSTLPRCWDYLRGAQDCFADAPLGLIHTGLHPANLVSSDSGMLTAIDWEHANIGDRAFEISGLLRRAFLPEETVVAIIHQYTGADSCLLERSKVYTEIFKLHEVLWHAIRRSMAERGELQLGPNKTHSYFAAQCREKLELLRRAEYAP